MLELHEARNAFAALEESWVEARLLLAAIGGFVAA
jgi:hypothetical protein